MNVAPDAVPTAALVRTNWEAAPTVPVAANVIGDPVNEPEVAVNVFDPTVVPRVHAGEVATPEAFVVTVPDDAREPPPVATAKVTDVPETPLPPESVTRTAGAIDTAEPAVADWELPALNAIVVAAPTETVTEALAVVRAPKE